MSFFRKLLSKRSKRTDIVPVNSSSEVNAGAVQELEFNVSYWCKHCGKQFDGVLRVQAFRHEYIISNIRFIRDRCPRCHSFETLPHVTPNSVVYQKGDPTLQHYAEAIKYALAGGDAQEAQKFRLLTNGER